MRLYSSLTRRKEELPPPPGPVRVYVCGPTVYQRIHVGNARPFVIFQWLERWLERQGYEVTLVENITDINDKIYDAAPGASAELAERTSRWYVEDTDALGLGRPDHEPKASETVSEIVSLIEELIARGLAYEVEGDVYFRVAGYADYGRLSGQRPDQVEEQEPNPLKEDARDFALWKRTKPGEDTSWPYWGGGRPGWHIECSAMALRLLGEPPIDIHGGGIDLVFPHHENEIAQAEGATGRPFARFWVHVEFLNVDNEKMSKSVGNVFAVRDVLDRGYRASALRYLLLSVHYRKQLTFSWDVLAQADAAVTRLADFRARVAAVSGGEAHAASAARVDAARRDFRERIADDLNVPGALGVMFELVRDVNAALDQGQVGEPDARAILDAFEAFDRVLGVLALRRAEDARPPVPEAELERLIAERQQARKHRDFARADAIRQDLEARGVILEDSATGTRWKRK